MDRAKTQQLISQLREEIRRREKSSSWRPVAPSGFAPLDNLLPGGGFPAGRIVELTGTPASGKTTLAFMAMGKQTKAGRLVAYVDSSGELYPPAIQALGVELSRLLIVYPCESGESGASLRITSMLARSQAFAVVAAEISPCNKLPGPPSRRLLEAAEAGNTAVILLCNTPSGLDSSFRIAVERTQETEVSLLVERSRMGPPGSRVIGKVDF